MPLLETTSDGGASWRQQDVDFGNSLAPDVAFEGVEFFDTSTGWLLAVVNSRSWIYGTEDGGEHWARLYQSTMRLEQLIFTSAESGWALGAGCSQPPVMDCGWHLLRTNDGGHEWDVQSLSDPAVVQLAHPNETTGWAWNLSPYAESPVSLQTTFDGADSWLGEKPPARKGVIAGSIFFLDSDHGWLLEGAQAGAGTQSKTLFYTSDSGQTWSTLAMANPDQPDGDLGLGGYVGPIVFTSESSGVIALGRRGILHSEDGGKHWEPALLDGAGGTPAIDFGDKLHGWAVGGRQLWKTSDGGASWQSVGLP